MYTPIIVTAPPGTCLSDVVPEGQYIVRLNGGVVIDTTHTYLLEGDKIELYELPAGAGDQGKAILSSVAIIAISLYAPALAGLAYPAKAGLAYHALTSGITLVGSLLVSALIPPPSQQNFGASGVISDSATPTSEGSAYRITGQSNSPRLYQTIPRIYGQLRFYPPIAATPIIENVGKTSTISMVYDFGLGWHDITDTRIGNLEIDQVDPFYREYVNTFTPDFEYFNRIASYDEYSYRLELDQSLTLVTSASSRDAILDVFYPAGLVAFDRNGIQRTHTVEYAVEYRDNSAGGAWSRLPASKVAGVSTAAQTWVYNYEYNYTVGSDKPIDGWFEDAVSKGTDVTYRRELYVGGRRIYTQTRKDSPYASTVISVNGKSYRQGTLRDSFTATGNIAVQIYEIGVPELPLSSTIQMSAATAVAFTASLRFNFPYESVWAIRITRKTEVSDEDSKINSIRDLSQVVLLKSLRSGKVLDLRKRHTMAELSFVANEKVSGVVQNFNAIVQSILRDITTTGFGGPAARSANPALIALDLLTGESARKPLKASQIDFASFHRLKLICDQDINRTIDGVKYVANRYEFNGVFESQMSLVEAVNTVLGLARAQLIRTSGGKIGILIDEPKTTYRQLITPANSWNFEATRTFTETPHAFRVSFLDRDREWEPTEVMVYNDGYSHETASVIEDLKTFGITSFPQAWNYGRYMLAQGIVRSEEFSVSMDVENLVVQRGDLVGIQHDVPMFGGGTFYATSAVAIAGGTRLTISAPIDTPPTSFTLRRRGTGAIVNGSVTKYVDENTIEISGSAEQGDLLVLGAGEFEIIPYIVKSIQAQEDLEARLVLVKYDERVYTAEEGPLPVWDPNFGDNLLSSSIQVTNLRASASIVYVGDMPHYQIVVEWSLLSNPRAYGGANVYGERDNNTQRLVNVVKDSELRAVYLEPATSSFVAAGVINFTVIPFTVLGNAGRASNVSLEIVKYVQNIDPPRNVQLDIRNQEISLNWELSLSEGVAAYHVRYSPNKSAPDWGSMQPVIQVGSDITKVTFSARTGVYMIRAAGTLGGMSVPIVMNTTVEDLPNMNVVQVIDDAPLWPGPKHGFTVSNGKLVVSPTVLKWSRAGLESATYEYARPYDFGDVYELFVQQKIELQVFDAAGNLDPNGNQYWNVWLEYRSSDRTAFMSSWRPLASLVTMAGSNAPFGEWRKITSGFVTGRVFGFRIVFMSDEPGYRAEISKGLITVDAEDRRLEISNVAANGWTRIAFTPAFFNIPVIAVDVVSATGVRYERQNLEATGVELRVLDAAGAAVPGVVDISVLGHGKVRSTSL